jgi:hypothetical protein
MLKTAIIFAVCVGSAMSFTAGPVVLNGILGLSQPRALAVSATRAHHSRSSLVKLRATESSIDDKTAGALAAVSFVALPVMLWSEFTLK